MIPVLSTILTSLSPFSTASFISSKSSFILLPFSSATSTFSSFSLWLPFPNIFFSASYGISLL
uniref:Myosin-13 n=1 Tax=Rhizophora mucronata TaxID=61149 RepID=A0A2P2NYP1_RHIMU